MALEMATMDPASSTQGSLHWVEDPRKIPVLQLQSMLGKVETYELDQQMRDAHLTLACLGQGALRAYACLTRGGHRSGYLAQVVVHPGHRRQGLGSQLLRRLLQHPSLQGLDRIFLEAQEPRGFFAALGFRWLETDLMVYGVRNCPVLS
jgi:N-acetylglutamate synthase-like GNAT family acetyltransferase